MVPWMMLDEVCASVGALSACSPFSTQMLVLFGNRMIWGEAERRGSGQEQ